MKNIDELLIKIAETQEIAPDDKLSSLIEGTASDELNYDDLFLVTAASKNDYEAFLEHIKSSN